MRRTLILPLFALAASACAPRASRVVDLAPVRAPEVVLAGGPEGESPAPRSGPTTGAGRPALATASAAPSARVAAAIERLRGRDLLIPVAGVTPSRIEDTFTAGRGGGERQHNAADILAPRNTPIVAADGGTILRMSTNPLGGITIYTADPHREFVYYYAHLERYHPDLVPGNTIEKGDTLGYVGTTGNSPANVPHLHFQIMLWPSDGKWWNGEPVNPYPVLRGASPSGNARLRFD